MKHILIVDDEDEIRSMYKDLLREEGFGTFEASTAGEALNTLIKNDKIDLVLLDINMPEIKGDYIFEIIEEYNPKIKVIISSAYSEEDQKQLIEKAAYFHDKSNGVDDLLGKIKDCLALK